MNRRKTLRIKKVSLLKAKLDHIHKPSIKIATTKDEFKQAFALTYKEYKQLNYIEENPSKLFFNVHHFLPETVVFLLKSQKKVIATLTQIFDSKLFGLPMDLIYRSKLDKLRDKGRKIAEFGALTAASSYNRHRLFMPLFQLSYCYGIYKEVTDICITVNPRHANIYKKNFLFEEIGAEKYFPKVNAMASGLSVDLKKNSEQLDEISNLLDFDCTAYSYFHKMAENKNFISTDKDSKNIIPKACGLMDIETVKYFIYKNKNEICKLPEACKNYFRSIYSGVKF